MGADSGAAGGGRRAAGAKPEINITPLVDVVLVLLIIFMVVTPQMEAGLSVALPSIVTPDEGSAPVDPTTVSVARDGRLFLEKDLIEPVPLLEKLRTLHEQKPAMRVVIKADVAVEYGKVRDLFRACQDIGFPGASLQVIDRANKKG